MARFIELLGAEASTTARDVAATRAEAAPVRVRTARVNAILGTALGDEEIKRHLDPIGFTTTIVGAGQLDVTIPTWRPDSAVEIDVIEEIARMYGYSAIERTVPSSTLTGALDRYQKDRRLVRQILAGAGASEAWTSTFVSPTTPWQILVLASDTLCTHCTLVEALDCFGASENAIGPLSGRL